MAATDLATPFVSLHPELARLLEQAKPLAWATFRLRLQAQQPCRLPDYLGSALRGVFGHAFKSAVCLVSHGDCVRCLLRARCPYPYVFETFRPDGAEWMTRYDTVPHPYLLLPPAPGDQSLQAGERLEVGFRIFGPAVELLPYFILAWEEMGRRGLGAGRHPFALEEISWLSPAGQARRIYVPGGSLEADPATLLSRFEPEATPPTGPVRLGLETPLRLTRDGRPLTDSLPFDRLVSSLLRRLSMLLYFHQRIQLTGDFGAVTRAAAEVPVLEQRLAYHGLPRWSNRQQRKMTFDGLSGEIVYGPEALAFWPLLRLGETLLAGKGTSFGLGRYRLMSAGPDCRAGNGCSQDG